MVGKVLEEGGYSGISLFFFKREDGVILVKVSELKDI